MMEKLRAGFNLIDQRQDKSDNLKFRIGGERVQSRRRFSRIICGKTDAYPRRYVKAWMAVDAETGLECDANEENGAHIADAVAWVTRAYFGGRIELCKQGVHRKEHT
jgi:hypothetical protein